MQPGQFFIGTWGVSGSRAGTRLYRFVGWNKKGNALCVSYDATNKKWGNPQPVGDAWLQDGNLLTDEQAVVRYGDDAVTNAPNAAPAPVTAIVKPEEDKLSSSILSADEFHKKLLNAYITFGENALAFQALVLEARERMDRGEEVGGCTTWTKYADKHFKRHDETLPTCLRRLRRVLEGHNPASGKHDGSKGRKERNQFQIGSEKENEIRTAASLPKDKPVTQALIKTFDAGWSKGHSVGYDVANNNHRINAERQKAEPPVMEPEPLPPAVEPQPQPVKPAELRKIKSLLGVPSHQVLPPLVLHAYQVGFTEGYACGHANGTAEMLDGDYGDDPTHENSGQQ